MANHCLKLLLCLLLTSSHQFVHGTGEGGVKKIGNLNCYVYNPTNSNIPVILASDVFGYGNLHLRQIAVEVGAAGFYAVVPDYFLGDPFVAGDSKLAWDARHPAEKGITCAEQLITALKEEGITKIGAAGFCWGGKVTADLAGSSHHIQAAVLLHPTNVTVTDIREVKVPILILGGQNDSTLPPSLVNQFETVLNKTHKDNSLIKIFPNAKHGFTTKYNDTDMPAVKRAKEAHKDMVDWFRKYLK